MTNSYEWIAVYRIADGFRIYAFREGAGIPKGVFPTKADAMAQAGLLPRKRHKIAFVDLRDKEGNP